jgi:hypothetical protein
VRRIAQKYYDCRNFLYLGRQYNFPVALEGALKLKEISYLHAEGYPAAEMKHGPIALVDENTPSVFVIPQGLVYDKVMSNLEEIKARRFSTADRHGHPAAALGVSRGRAPRLRRRQAAKSGKECDGGVTGQSISGSWLQDLGFRFLVSGPCCQIASLRIRRLSGQSQREINQLAPPGL